MYPLHLVFQTKRCLDNDWMLDVVPNCMGWTSVATVLCGTHKGCCASVASASKCVSGARVCPCASPQIALVLRTQPNFACKLNRFEEIVNQGVHYGVILGMTKPWHLNMDSVKEGRTAYKK